MVPIAVWTAAAVCGAAGVQPGAVPGAERLDEPRLVDGMLVFPQDAAIPRFMTEAERRFVAQNPIVAARSGGAPTGPVQCPGEYEPMQAILLSWNGQASWLTIVTQMANRITRFGDAEAWIVVRDQATENSARTQLTNGNVDMTKVRFFQRRLDSIWIRDYGPRYIFEGDCRAIVDHTYNRPRPNDNALPAWLGPRVGHAVYTLPLIHGGGNFHLSSLGQGYATRLINNENPGKTEGEIIDLWHAFQNLDTRLFEPFPTTVDLTQHIDMWVQVFGDRRVMVSDWPLSPGSTQDLICDAAAEAFAGEGYTVHRVPAVTSGGTHYTYTNVVLCNDLVLIPSYTAGAASPYNAQALSAWSAALPGKTIFQVNCQALVTAAGVMHCIAMHVPAPRGGANPTAYVQSLNEPAVLERGSVFGLRWITDDDLGVGEVDLLLSTDGGATYPRVIASGIPDSGAFDWAVPDEYLPRCRVKVVVRDADGNAGHDANDADFSVGVCAADFDRDGFLDLFDVDLFFGCFEGLGCPEGADADFNGDGFVDFFDADAFLDAFDRGC